MFFKKATFRFNVIIGICFLMFGYLFLENYQRIRFALSGYIISEATTNASSSPLSIKILFLLIGIYFFVIIVIEIMKNPIEQNSQNFLTQTSEVSEALESVGIH